MKLTVIIEIWYEMLLCTTLMRVVSSRMGTRLFDDSRGCGLLLQ